MTFISPLQAESAFYAAFRSDDHVGMMAVWANNEDLICVHPMGPRLDSRDIISASWQQILTGEPQRSFDIHLVTSWGDSDVSVHIVNEIISVPASELQFTPVLATNVYKFTGTSWYMIAHHASIDATSNRSVRADEQAPTRH